MTPIPAIAARGGEIDRLFEELTVLGRRSIAAVFTTRALRAVASLGRSLSEPALRKAAEAPSDYAALLTALETEPALGVLAQEDPLAQARIRGLRAMQELLAKEGGVLSAEQVAEHLDLSRQAVYKRHRAGRLIAVKRGRHGLAYPAWQLAAGGVLPGLEEVLEALHDEDAWMQLVFFVSENRALGGETPVAALRRGELESVLRAAHRYGEQGAV